MSRRHYFVPFFLVCFMWSCDFSPHLHKEVLEAQDFINSQEYDKAALKYKKILSGVAPKKIKIKIFYQLGELYSIHLDNNDLAIEYYSKILKLSEDLRELVKVEEKIAEILFSYLKNFNQAVISYKRLIKFKPRLKKHDFYQYRLGLSYLNSGNLQKSEDTFQEIIKLKDHEYYLRSLYNIGLIHFKGKEWKKAIQYWESYIALEKRRDSVVHTKFLMGNAFETMEELKKAYNIYYSILGEYPNNDVIKNRLNSLYKRRIARKR
ncbi:tetratricopeptide repeat protein [Bacteriovoracales bacterium]|nr:tetratricopeptide repeat protein [Bacteriovoracales bacterium]